MKSLEPAHNVLDEVKKPCLLKYLAETRFDTLDETRHGLVVAFARLFIAIHK
jgi:hypothetical protein